METLSADDWADLFAHCQRAAWHLEMRDVYAVAEEADDFAAWREGRWDADQDAAKRKGWLDLIRATAGRGVQLRRARIVSEPVTDFIRFEHSGTALNIDAGEDVRWLPRTRAARIMLPGADFWLFDEVTVVYNHFTGDGSWHGNETTGDPVTAHLCAAAFQAVWEAAIPHHDYQLI